jgi:hypothetical protein
MNLRKNLMLLRRRPMILRKNLTLLRRKPMILTLLRRPIILMILMIPTLIRRPTMPTIPTIIINHHPMDMSITIPTILTMMITIKSPNTMNPLNITITTKVTTMITINIKVNLLDVLDAVVVTTIPNVAKILTLELLVMIIICAPPMIDVIMESALVHQSFVLIQSI